MRAAASHPGPHPALVAVIMASGLLALGTVGLATGRYGFVADRTLVGLTAIGYGGLGAWVWMRAVPEIGRRMTVVALAAALNWAAQGWSAMTIAGWASRWTWLLPALLIPLVLSRFPDGRPPVRRGHLIERALAASTVIATLALALAAIGAPNTMRGDAPVDAVGWSVTLGHVSIVACGSWALAAAALLTGVFRRSRCRSGADRGQLMCLAVALLVTFAAVVGLVVWDTLACQVVVAVALPLGIATAVLRYAWFDLDLLVHRVAVWSVLTVAVVAAVAGAGWFVTRLVPDRWARFGDVVIVVALVLALDPGRRLAQRGVSRLLYGNRDAPARALSDLGQGLGSATARHSAEDLCRSVAAALALPWVGLRQEGSTVAAWGRPTSAPFEISLRSDPRQTTLLLCPRRAGERLGRADLRIVNAVAAQVEVAVRALALAEDLQGARERLVRSREEERKRLRNELHDGVGPALAGARLQVRALSRTTTDGWGQVDDDLRCCADEIARLIDGLRPPALDAGLSEALRREAARWSAGDVAVRVDVGGLEGTPSLPAAVETAAYRIAAEAVSNAVRHAAAATITVAVERPSPDGPDVLEVRVSDDGTGVLHARDGGVGLTSMRDRAAELGGRLSIAVVPGHGTTVEAVLPIGGSPT